MIFYGSNKIVFIFYKKINKISKGGKSFFVKCGISLTNPLYQHFLLKLNFPNTDRKN